MSEYDSDIEFDFFDDQETGESPPPPGRPRSQRPPGPPPPKRPPEHARHPAGRTARRPDRVRDPDHRPARPLGAELLGDEQEVVVPELPRQGAGARPRLERSSARRSSQAIATPGITAAAARQQDGHARRAAAERRRRGASKLKEPRGLPPPQREPGRGARSSASSACAASRRRSRAGAGSTKVAETATALALQGRAARGVGRDLGGQVPPADASRDDAAEHHGSRRRRCRTSPRTASTARRSGHPVVERLNGNSTSGGSTTGQLDRHGARRRHRAAEGHAARARTS